MLAALVALVLAQILVFKPKEILALLLFLHQINQRKWPLTQKCQKD